MKGEEEETYSRPQKVPLTIMYMNYILSAIYSYQFYLKQVTINMTRVAKLKYFTTQAKFCLSYYYQKALVKCFEFVLTVIPTKKIVCFIRIYHE